MGDVVVVIASLGRAIHLKVVKDAPVDAAAKLEPQQLISQVQAEAKLVGIVVKHFVSTVSIEGCAVVELEVTQAHHPAEAPTLTVIARPVATRTGRAHVAAD